MVLHVEFALRAETVVKSSEAIVCLILDGL